MASHALAPAVASTCSRRSRRQPGGLCGIRVLQRAAQAVNACAVKYPGGCVPQTCMPWMTEASAVDDCGMRVPLVRC